MFTKSRWQWQTFCNFFFLTIRMLIESLRSWIRLSYLSPTRWQHWWFFFVLGRKRNWAYLWSVWMKSSFLWSMWRTLRAIFIDRRKRVPTFENTDFVLSRTGMARKRDRQVRRRRLHHFKLHHGAIIDIRNDIKRRPRRSIERGMSICWMVLSI